MGEGTVDRLGRALTASEVEARFAALEGLTGGLKTLVDDMALIVERLVGHKDDHVLRLLALEKRLSAPTAMIDVEASIPLIGDEIAAAGAKVVDRQPWIALGIPKATYYWRKKAGKL